MAKEIIVSTDTLSNDIDELEEALKTIKKNIDDMYDAVKTLDTMWEGPANDAFNKQFQTDREGMGTLCDNVKGMIDCLRYAKKEYDSCERTISSVVSSITV